MLFPRKVHLDCWAFSKQSSSHLQSFTMNDSFSNLTNWAVLPWIGEHDRVYDTGVQELQVTGGFDTTTLQKVYINSNRYKSNLM